MQPLSAIIAAILALALPLHAATAIRHVEVSFYCFGYAPGVESIQVDNGGKLQAIRLSTANITQPVSLPVTAGKVVILRATGDPATPAASLTLREGIDKALVVLMPAAAGSSEPYRAFAIDYGHAQFPLGTYQLVNVSTHPVRGAIGRSFAEVKPGAIAGLQLQGEPGTTQGVRFEFQEDGKWNRLTETRCAVRRDRRWLVCVYQDPATHRMNLRSIPDRPAVAANTTTSTAATASR